MTLFRYQDAAPPFSTDDWEQRLTMEQKRERRILSSPGVADDARYLLDASLSRALIALSIHHDAGEALSAATQAATMAAAAVLSTRFSHATISIHLPGDRLFRFPGGGSALTPWAWFRGLACALIARDQTALDLLCAPANINSAQLPESQADSFWPFLCTAAAMSVARPEAVASWLSEAETLMRSSSIQHALPEMIRLQVSPILPMLHALAGTGDWNAAQRAAVEGHKEFYEHNGGAGDPNRLLSLVICGLTAEALDRGIAKDTGTLPEDFLRGSGGHSTGISLAFPPRFAEHPSDPSVLLDLEGVPTEQRQHIVVAKDGHTIARYRLEARPGIPPTVMEFVLGKAGESRGTTPPALDPGERVLAAEFYASKEVAASLHEAVAQIDHVLQIIPPGSHAVPPAAFVNPAGVQVWRDEPGRFERDRLLAYRNALQDQLEPPHPDADLPPRPSTTPELEGYVRAIAASEIVREAARPILLQVASRDGAQTIASMRPQPGDYDRVFVPETVDTARKAYEALWSKPLPFDPPSPSQTELRIAVAAAGLLRGPNDLSRHFPSGYLGIAPQLKPERVWLAWKYVKPGETSGMAYDGLVWCDDHWAWFPRPFRMLRQ